MAKATKVLFISQEISPFVEDSPLSKISRALPQNMQEKGFEVRAFMPKYGIINERRNQLHEVIRLSGMNIIIDDTDHPLIIKVASIPTARIQVYFIDNEDYFQRPNMYSSEPGVEYDDNDERSIFFIRGVFETIKKLRWVPDIIYCQGWLSALAPLYLKTLYSEDPSFRDSKIIYSHFDTQRFQEPLNSRFLEKLAQTNIPVESIQTINSSSTLDFETITKLALEFSDGVVQAEATISPAIENYINERELPFLKYQEEDMSPAISEMFQSIFDNFQE